MAFIVEDGTIVTNANAYIPISFADAYFTDRNDASWTGSSSIKQGAIVRATDYIDIRFGSSLLGTVVNSAQPLMFPRLIAGDNVGVPLAIQKACAEYAKIALSQLLIITPAIAIDGLPISKTVTKIGPIEDTVEYDNNIPAITIRPYPTGDLYLAPYTKYGSNKVSR